MAVIAANAGKKSGAQKCQEQMKEMAHHGEEVKFRSGSVKT